MSKTRLNYQENRDMNHIITLFTDVLIKTMEKQGYEYITIWQLNLMKKEFMKNPNLLET